MKFKSIIRMGWRYFLSLLVRLRNIWIFKYVQQIYYGNTIDSMTNRICKKNWSKAIKESALKPSNLHKQFIREGYVSLGHIFDNKYLIDLQEEFKIAIDSAELSESPYDDPVIRSAYNYKNFSGDVKKFRRDIKDCDKSLPTIKKIINNKNFQKIIREVIGCQNYELSAPYFCAWRNYHVPQNISDEFEVITNRFHFDNQLVDRFKIFIYLSDVTLADGPFQHFPKSYSRVLLLRGFQENKRKLSITGGLPLNIFHSSKLVKHVGKAGHVIICATSFCLHRAGELAPGHYRDLLQISVRPKLQVN